MSTLTKEDVLARDELTIDVLSRVKHLKIQGDKPDNQFWDGGKCYVPVVYMGQPYKCRQRIKSTE